jgi:tetratricopeptide (TPR) repeat protein
LNIGRRAKSRWVKEKNDGQWNEINTALGKKGLRKPASRQKPIYSSCGVDFLNHALNRMSERPKNKKPVAPRRVTVSPAVKMPGASGFPRQEFRRPPAVLKERGLVFGICAFLTAITWLVFGQTLGHQFFNLDDDVFVYQDAAVTKGLTPAGIARALAHGSFGFWDPLTTLSHMLDCQLYGLHPGGHHLTNVLLHTASVILLFLVLRKMTGALWPSAFVAALFAIHPLRVESVAWVSERKDVLSGFFFMLTLGTYAFYASGPPKLSRYLMVVMCFALGLMSKVMLVTLPLVLIVLDYWPLGRIGFAGSVVHELSAEKAGGRVGLRSRLVLEKIPLLLLSAGSAIVAVFAQKQVGTVQSLGNAPVSLRVANALVSAATYLRQMFCPTGLAVLYPYPFNGLPGSEVALAALALAGISAAAWFWRRGRPYLLAGWLWYLIMLAPVIGILQVGPQARADRYTYLPQIGVYVLLTWAAAELSAGWRWRRVVLGGGGAMILGALVFCARAQCSYWRDSESLWTQTLACTSGNFIGHNNLGDALLEKGRVDEAITHFQKALQIKPDYAKAWNNLGLGLLKKGSEDEAIADFQRALQINPGLAEAHNNLGDALLQKGSVDEAIAQFQLSLQFRPDLAEAHCNLAGALMRKGNMDEAIAHFQQALQINPGNAEAQYDLGNAMLRKGNVDEAIAHFRQALQINPGFAEAHNNLGSVLLQKGSLDEAIVHFQKFLEIKPGSAAVENNLANALLRKGRVAEAIRHFQKALQINPDDREAGINLAWVLATASEASLRNGSQAVELAQRANQLTGDRNPVVLCTLAAAYAESGRYPEAVTAAQRALELAESQSNTALADSLRLQLKNYQAGLPYHSH